VVGVLKEVHEREIAVVVKDARAERVAILEFGSIAEARRVVTF